MGHKVKAEKFFSNEERERITKTVRNVESRTIGEVAVMVVDNSDRYIEAEIIGTVFLGSATSLLVTVLFFDASLWLFVALSFLSAVPSFYVFKKIPLLKTPFIGFRRKEEVVMNRAVRAFYEKGLYKTRKNTGVLFFLSLFERKVWVLADKGIYEKIDQETLNRFAATVSKGIGDERACDALCDAMKEAGELLAEHFPITSGDIDELPNNIITE
jgi:putative membrane protein